MIRNYIVSAYRNIIRSKLDSILNISGLIIGLSAALLIALFIRYENSYDLAWADADRLFRVQTRWVLEGRDDIQIVHSEGPLKAALENYFPAELAAVARMHLREPVISTGTESFKDVVSFADPEILDIFSFDVIAGDVRQALQDNASIILTETLARKYFAESDPLGKILTLDNRYLKRDYKVVAVIRDLPENTHLRLQALIKIDESDYADNDGSWMFSDWNAANNHTYFKLHPEIDIGQVNSQITTFTDAMVPSNDGKASRYTKYSSLAVSDIHLYSRAAGSMKPGGDIQVVIAFSIIALLVVVVATINYINLTTARAGQRAREIAMRKVVGARRHQLIAQHLGESLLMVGFATLMAVVVVEASLPLFNRILGMDLGIGFADPVLLGTLVVTVLIVGGLSGIYPALILSSYRPASTLRASSSGDSGGMARSRNVLVVFQTVITVSLIVATAVVYAQLSYFRSLDRGFDPGELLVLEDMERTGVIDQRDAFVEELIRLPEVSRAVLNYEAPTRFYENNVRFWMPGQNSDESYPLGSTRVDYGYLDVFDIPLLAGRFYDPDRALDAYPSTDGVEDGEVLQSSIVINERAVTAMGLGTPAEAVGRQLIYKFPVDDEGIGQVSLSVIGVIGNTHMHTAKIPVRPEVFWLQPYYHNLIVRYSGDANRALHSVEVLWRRMMGGEPFEYFYVADALAEEFRSETGQANVFLGFAVLTMFIACLGLYGLAAFVTERRRKEIGIRKILGAKIRDILSLLFGQFARLVLLANIIAWPLAYMLMTEWLQQYPLRIANLWVAVTCVLAGLLASIVVAATVGSQAWGAAKASPIQAIRQE